MKVKRLFSFTMRKKNTFFGRQALTGWLENDVSICQRRQFAHNWFQS